MADRNIRVSLMLIDDNTDTEDIGEIIETSLKAMGVSCLVDVKEVETV